MTAAELHLMVVHLPVVGCLFVAVLLVLGHVLGSDLLLKVGYGFSIALALLGVAAFYSGPSAYEQLQTELLAQKPWVEQHALVARAAFIGLVVCGALAVQAHLQFLQEEPPARWLRFTILVLVLAMSYLLAWSAHLGGAIRHHEVRAEEGEWTPFPRLESGSPIAAPAAPAPPARSAAPATSATAGEETDPPTHPPG